MVLALLELLLHGGEVHWALNDGVVLWHLSSWDRLSKELIQITSLQQRQHLVEHFHKWLRLDNLPRWLSLCW